MKQEEDQATIRKAEKSQKLLRYLTFAMLLFAIMLLTDKYLPYNVYHETAEVGWQESRQESRSKGGKRRPAKYYSFMQTQSYVFEVENTLHLQYPYYEKNKPLIAIAVTRLFQLPIHVSYELKNRRYSSDVQRLALTTYLPLTWLLLISSLLALVKKEPGFWTYTFAFVPFILVVWVMLGFG